MARRTATVVIDAEGRDKGKAFLLTEMSASQAERWAARALLAIARNGVDIPEGIASAGLAGVAAVGLRALGGMAFDDAEPLLADMMACVQAIPDPARPSVVRFLIEADIEEVATRLRLRMEVFELHLGFSVAGSLPK
jgi:hypothetical protein